MIRSAACGSRCFRPPGRRPRNFETTNGPSHLTDEPLDAERRTIRQEVRRPAGVRRLHGRRSRAADGTRSRILIPAWAPASGDRDFWEYDELLSWRHTPGALGRFSYADFDVDVRLNADGHRDADHSFERTPGRHRALLLGDSFGWGYGVEQDEIFVERIDARRPDWEIVNTSVSGYGTDQQYLYYRDRGHRYAPDLVILLFSGNDVENAAHSVQYWHNKPLFQRGSEGLELTNVPVPPPTPTQDVANWVGRNTWFLRTASRGAAAWLAPARAGASPAPPPPRPNAESDTPTRADSLSGKEMRIVEILEALDIAARRGGARLVVVSLPGLEGIFEHGDFRALGITHLSLSGVFQDSDEPVTFEHDRHWTAAGHRIVAEAVESFLLEQGLFEPRDADAGG